MDKPIELAELNLLLWATRGITGDLGGYQLRTPPSVTGSDWRANRRISRLDGFAEENDPQKRMVKPAPTP